MPNLFFGFLSIYVSFILEISIILAVVINLFVQTVFYKSNGPKQIMNQLPVHIAFNLISVFFIIRPIPMDITSGMVLTHLFIQTSIRREERVFLTPMSW